MRRVLDDQLRELEAELKRQEPPWKRPRAAGADAAPGSHAPNRLAAHRQSQEELAEARAARRERNVQALRIEPAPGRSAAALARLRAGHQRRAPTEQEDAAGVSLFDGLLSDDEEPELAPAEEEALVDAEELKRLQQQLAEDQDADDDAPFQVYRFPEEE